MTARVKSTLIVSVTLLIGIVLGALLHARLSEDRIERIAFLRSQRGFERGIERMIDYESDEQREAVREILDGTAGRIGLHYQDSRGEMGGIIDSMRMELSTVLTEEQMERLDERLEMRRPERWRQRRGPRGEPPPR
jgi:hypothetical protein